MHRAGPVLGLAFSTFVFLAATACSGSKTESDAPAATSSPASPTPTASAVPSAANVAPKADAAPCLTYDEPGCQQKCSAGDAESCSRLASLYSYGSTNLQVDKPKAIELYERGCNKDVGKDCHFLSAAFAFGQGVEKDEARGKELEKKAGPLLVSACEAKDAESCLLAADYMSYGKLPNDEKKEAEYRKRSSELYLRACEGEDASSCFMAANDLLRDKNDEGAFNALTRGCDGGDADSCRLLAAMHKEGIGSQADPSKAPMLIDKACKGGSENACSD